MCLLHLPQTGNNKMLFAWCFITMYFTLPKLFLKTAVGKKSHKIIVLVYYTYSPQEQITRNIYLCLFHDIIFLCLLFLEKILFIHF